MDFLNLILSGHKLQRFIADVESGDETYTPSKHHVSGYTLITELCYQE
jgi:hypothetical protein